MRKVDPSPLVPLCQRWRVRQLWRGLEKSGEWEERGGRIFNIQYSSGEKERGKRTIQSSLFTGKAAGAGTGMRGDSVRTRVARSGGGSKWVI